jgi:stress response protein SCP2
MEIKEIKFEGEKTQDSLFKFTKKISEELDEDIDTSTFIMAEDALSTGSDIIFFKDLKEDDSNIIMDFISK